MQSVRAVILGFGTVGQGIFNIAQQRRAELREQHQVELVIAKVLVTDAARAGRALPEGFDASLLTDKIEDVLASGPIDTVFECMVGAQPAYDHVRALVQQHGCAVVTANKVMFAKHGAALRELAGAAGRQVGYEACVAGGVPVIKTLQNMKLVQHITKVEGILNGTTNFILTSMRTNPGKSYEATLAEAQAKGYAEADPYNDVSGMDAFSKLMILSELAFGAQPAWPEVPVVGIQEITAAKVAEASAQQQRYRHVASTELVTEGGQRKIVASIRPLLVDAQHALYAVEDVHNAVAVSTDYLGVVTLMGPGAGMYPTASVMVEDWLTFVQQNKLKSGSA
ncbi:homoserine dehydrogenase [Strigomonas culicis]|uniref:Homoserine dehydrogenase n=1 Tax=Strigomonas culicis TaxID=28005 RepID=S9UM95_9TRYP|nr:homoserine dehydrogenase [Strigomonas culicis]EPY30038.1 homoserine dehydrogenase [Strigomonas culicis]|eukprot:EPY30038.1 homoserine dehydrogenase [Strigomonas culicis]